VKTVSTQIETRADTNPAMSANCQISMLEIAKNLLLCRQQVAECEDLCVRGEGTEKLKFKLVSLQLVNQIFCKKLRRKDAEIERLTVGQGGEVADTATEQAHTAQEVPVLSQKEQDVSPRLSFSELYEDDCLKSKISIRFRKWSDEFEETPIDVLESKETSQTATQGGEKKFVARERRKGRSKSLMNYRRKFSTKKSKFGERRHHSVKARGDREGLRHQTSCPDLVEAGRQEARQGRRGPRRNTSNVYDSIDDFTSQLFTDDLLPGSEVDLLSICFE